jgi:threonine dehydrogenase-like Zn-dependent dehydrogenase
MLGAGSSDRHRQAIGKARTGPKSRRDRRRLFRRGRQHTDCPQGLNREESALLIDAVGLEAHSPELQSFYDKVKIAIMLETDRPSVLRQAIQSVRKGGTLSIPGVYRGPASGVESATSRITHSAAWQRG